MIALTYSRMIMNEIWMCDHGKKKAFIEKKMKTWAYSRPGLQNKANQGEYKKKRMEEEI